MARSCVIRLFHKKLLANGIPNLENLIDLQLMQEKEYVLMAFPASCGRGVSCPCGGPDSRIHRNGRIEANYVI